jgi:hypothetical protein
MDGPLVFERIWGAEGHEDHENTKPEDQQTMVVFFVFLVPVVSRTRPGGDQYLRITPTTTP